MVYIYDILLNFNKKLIEFFEWEDNDNIKYIKKIGLFKVSSSFISDIVHNEVILSSSFVSSIPKYEMNGIRDTFSACLFTDGFIVIGVLIKNFKIVSFSRLLLDEEQEALDISNSLDIYYINYEVLGSRDISFDFLTRNERDIKNKLTLEIESLYKEKNYDKLFYLYYEYFSRESLDVDYTYKCLIKSLNSFNNKHMHLFDILMMSKVRLEED